MEEQQKGIEWTHESIRRFWNYHGQKPQIDSEYFSFQVGDALVNLLKRANAFPQGGSILDFGCGPGFLLERLLTTNNTCYGFDFSDGTVDRVNRKFFSRKNWEGAISATQLPTSYDASLFDVITCIETLEHLLDDMIPTTLGELHRLLKRNGIVFFTVPSDENLAESSVYCPFCDHEFHKVQHVRSFNNESIAALLSHHGFRICYCQSIDLFELQGNKRITRHNVARILKSGINFVLDALSPLPGSGKYKTPRCSAGPNLCVIAEKV